MKITSRQNKDFTSVCMEGKLDAANAAEAEKSLSEIYDAGMLNLVVDLSNLEYVSSAGMRVLLVLAKKVQQKGGRVSLSNLSAKVREVFDISGFSTIFKIFNSAAEAEAYIRG